MKLAVTRCDGDTEILTINNPVNVCEGSPDGQARIHSGEGLIHYFRLSDGRYDGWECEMPSDGWTREQANTLMESVQNGRIIVPATIRGILLQRAKKVYQFCRWWYGHLLGQPGF